MSRLSIGARLASVGGATLLIAGLLTQAAPALATGPGPAMSSSHAGSKASVHQGQTTSVNLRTLAAKGPSKLPFDPKAVGKVLQSVESATNAPSAPSGVKPNVVGPPAPDLATVSGAPAATTPVAVAGLTGAASSAGPDSGVAVGPDWVLQTANTSLSVFDRAGNSLSGVPTITLPTLFSLTETGGTGGHTTFDAEPRIMFDTIRQRWVAIELSWDCSVYKINPGDQLPTFGHGFLDYAISDTTDPSGFWTSSSFYWTDLVPDLPSLGSTSDKLALSAGLFEMGPGGSNTTPGCLTTTEDTSAAIAVDWSELGPDFDSPAHLGFFLYPELDALRVATQEPIVAADVRMIGLSNGTGPGETAGDVIYVDLTGSAVHGTDAEATYRDLTADAILPQFLAPPSPVQPGGTLTAAISAAPDSVVFSGSILAFAATYPCIPTGDSVSRDCVRVTSLNSTNPALEPARRADVLLATNGQYNSFGSIAFAGNGVLQAVYTGSSATLDPSSISQYQTPGPTGSTAWSAPATLTAGVAAYGGTGWGAASIVASDPQDPSAAWVGDPATALGGGWATTIHELVVGGAGAGYFPITPVRVLDSRTSGLSTLGFSGVLVANLPRTFAVANTPGIPVSAIAITGNLTVTGQTKAGYVALTPTPTANPSSSTLNFPTGENRGNNTTIVLAPDGSLAVVYKAPAGAHTNVILDVTGYFSTTGVGQRFTPLAAPVRILNTTPGTNLGATTFHANLPKTFLVADGTMIPSGAAAITGNLAILNQTHAGYVTLSPTPDPSPTTSTINFPTGDTRANGLTIPINPLDGTVAAVFKAPSGTVDLVLDVTGYYSSDVSGLLFHPLNPGRRIDTRLAAGLDGFGNGLTGAQGTSPRSVVIAGHDGLPAGAKAITGNLSITGQTAAGYVSVTTSSVLHPTTSTINFPLGDTRGNGITTSLGSGPNAGLLWFVYQHTFGKHVQLILDLTGYFE